MDNILELIKITKSYINSATPISGSNAELLRLIEQNYAGTIPGDIQQFLVNAKNLPGNAYDIFSGYEPLTLEMVAEEYVNIPNGIFFSGFSMNCNLISAEDARLRIWKSLEGELESELEMSDMKRIVPLFNGGAGFYTCLFFNDSGQSELAIVTQDYYICSYAPSLTEHVENLETGLAKNIYRVTEDDLLMPTDWYKRIKAVGPSGLPESEWEN